MNTTAGLRVRLLAALAAAGAVTALMGSSSCGSKVVVSTGSGGASSTSSAGGASVSSSGVGGSDNCYTDDIGTCCDYSSCFTLVELAAYTLDGVPPAQCPSYMDLESWEDFCEWFSGGPTTNGDLCCYEMGGGDCCGRPFVVSGEARRAGVAQRADWSRDVAKAEALDDATRAALAHAWLEDARLEHASIASFARFTLQLLGLGAPPELVAGAQRASLDEIEHARACFALASRYAGEGIGPGPMALEGALAGVDLAEAAVSAVREGCVGETMAAALAAEQLSVAEDEDVRRALSAIARDEEAHAELSWRFVRWAIEAGGAPVRAARAFAELLAAAPPTTSITTEAVDTTAWHRHGRLTRAEIERVTQAVRREVIAPCARALLAPTAPRQHAVA